MQCMLSFTEAISLPCVVGDAVHCRDRGEFEDWRDLGLWRRQEIEAVERMRGNGRDQASSYGSFIICWLASDVLVGHEILALIQTSVRTGCRAAEHEYLKLCK